MTIRTIDEIWRDYVTDGVPSSGAWEPLKPDIRDTLNSLLGNAARPQLSSSRSYYVRTDGSDSNNGLANTSGGAFLTIQKAIDLVHEDIDLNGFTVTINVAAGTYTGLVDVSGPWVGEGAVNITGVGATTIIAVNSASPAVNVDENAVLGLTSLKITNAGAGSGVNAATGGVVTCNGVDTGAIGGSAFNCGSGALINIVGNYTISGGGTSHWHCGGFGQISASNLAITVTGTPAFSAYFCGTAQGAVTAQGTTFTGSATGRRYLAHYGGVIMAGGLDNDTFPGSIAGYAPGGGYYGSAQTGSNAVDYWISPEIYVSSSLGIRSKNYNADTWNIHFKTQNALTTGQGWFYTNGDDGFSSGRTHFSGEATVTATSGTTDGWTFGNKSVAAGGGIVFTVSATASPVGNMRRRTSDGNVLVFYRDTTAVGSVSVTGSATSFVTSSDYRLKEDVYKIDGAIDLIMKLEPVDFKWKGKDARSHGFIAHVLQKHVPDAVSGKKDATEDYGDLTGPDGDVTEAVAKPEQLADGWKWKKTGTRNLIQGVDHSKLVPDLTAALQEAVTIIRDLTKRIEALEQKK